MPNEVKIISNTRIAIDGFLYVRSREGQDCTYWDCKRVRDRVCKARAITKFSDGSVIVMKGPDKSIHTHPPSWEEVNADKVKHRIKQRAQEAHFPPVVILQGISLIYNIYFGSLIYFFLH